MGSYPEIVLGAIDTRHNYGTLFLAYRTAMYALVELLWWVGDGIGAATDRGLLALEPHPGPRRSREIPSCVSRSPRTGTSDDHTLPSLWAGARAAELLGGAEGIV